MFSDLATTDIQTMLWDSAIMFAQLFGELTVLFLLISYTVAIINQKLPAQPFSVCSVAAGDGAI